MTEQENGLGDKPGDSRVAVGSPDLNQVMRASALGIAGQSRRTSENKFKLEELGEIIEFFDAEVEISGMSKGERIEMIQSIGEGIRKYEHETALPDAEWEQHVPPVEEFEEVDANGLLVFAYRCTHCGQHPVVFKPGFDPRSPGVDESGHTKLFRFWPLKFRAHSHVPEYALRVASRENPQCHFCNKRVPLFSGGTRLLERGIVAFRDIELRDQLDNLPAVHMKVDSNLR